MTWAFNRDGIMRAYLRFLAGCSNDEVGEGGMNEGNDLSGSSCSPKGLDCTALGWRRI